MSGLRLGVASLPLSSLDEFALALGIDLIDTMRASPACVGLAAPQIGVELRAFAIDCSGHKKTTVCHGELVVFNPQIVSVDQEIIEREGCMSVPDLTGDVPRAVNIVVEGWGVDGEKIHIASCGFEARALQHEIDHLDGLVFLDRVISPNGVHQRRLYR
jgi:peptide deformylase